MVLVLVYGMKHTTTLRILGSVCIVVIVLVLGYLDLLGFYRLVSSVTDLVLFFLGIFATFAFQLIVWPERFAKTTTTQVEPVVTAQTPIQAPTLSFEPLILIPSGKRVESQWANMVWSRLGVGEGRLAADFGVIRVHALRGEALRCRAEARFKSSELKDMWLNGGFLNWYSASLRRNLTSVVDFGPFLLNKYLKNTTEDIHEGETKDLLLFYMIKNSSFIALCSDMDMTPVGNVQGNNQPLKFQVEISVTAEHCRKIVLLFDVMAAWDNFIIQRCD